MKNCPKHINVSANKKLQIFTLFVCALLYAPVVYGENNNQSRLVVPVVGDNPTRSFNIMPPSRIKNPEDAGRIAKKIRNKFEIKMQSLHKRLQINSDQQNAWNTYLERSRAQLPTAEVVLDMSQKRREEGTPENARKRLGKMQSHMDRLQKTVDAYEILYNSATPAQQEILRLVDYRKFIMGKLPHRGDRK